MRKQTITFLMLLIIIALAKSQSTTTILSEGFEPLNFPTGFTKTGNTFWNLNTSQPNDYTGIFWDNLYTSTSSTQVSEISTTEYHGGSQSLKLTLTAAAQALSPKLRAKENTLTPIGQTISDWANYKVTMFVKVLKPDGSPFATGVKIFTDHTLNATDTWQEFTFNSTTSKYSSGLSATKVFIAFANIGEDCVVYIDDVTVQKTDNEWKGTTSIQWNAGGNWSDGAEPGAGRNVYIPAGTTPNPNPQVSTTGSPQFCYNLYIENGVSLNYPSGATSLIVAPGAQVTNNGSINITAAGTLTLQSNAGGSATVVNNGTITGNVSVEQYLPSARNWYISSPVTAAKAKTGYTFYSRDETLLSGTDGWVTMTTGDGITTGDALTPGKGYIANLASGTATYSFAGTLNNGNVDVAVTRTGATAQSGFNLVGNPYPSYINWDNATLTNVKTTIWQRSNTGSAYVFDTYNSSGNVAVDLSGNRTNGNIAPMQAFWVQVADGQASGTVGFTNSMRAHKGSKAITGGTVNDPIFKVGASTTTQSAMIRLQVSNGINTDETVLYQNDNAQNNVDMYDSPKMSNSSAAIPEIYSLVNGNKLTINGVNSIVADTELPLGFVTGQANSFSLKVSQLSNMNPEIQLVLKDKVTGAQQVMTEGSVYSFTSDATAASDRFSVLFRSSSSTTGVNEVTAKNKFGVYVNETGAIVVDLFNENVTGSATVYNIAGSKVGSQLLKASKSVLGMKAASGIYMVKVSNGVLTETHRVIIK